MVDADHLHRAVGVAVAHDGHGQLHPFAVVREQAHNDLLDRAGGGQRQGHVLHHGVALVQSVHRTVDEGA